MMTPDQKKEVKRIDSELKKIFPRFHGSIKFNLNPNPSKYYNPKDTNINVAENVIS